MTADLTTAAPGTLPSPTGDLAELIRYAMAALSDTHRLHPTVLNGHLDVTLRAAAARIGDATGQRAGRADPGAQAIVRTVCAWLFAGSYEDAYIALLHAEAHIPPTSTPLPQSAP